MPDESVRNPLFVPEVAKHRPCCPKCKGTDFSGRKVQGQVTFFCRAKGCGNSWQGGLPQEPMDPRLPRPHEPTPLVNFIADKTGNVIEERRAPDLRADFRKGAPIGEDE